MIVGICGEAGSGKDATADFLVKSHGFSKIALADPLKRICQNVYGFSDDQLWGPSWQRNKPDRRWEHGAQGYRDAALREFGNGQGRAQKLLAEGQDWQRDTIVETLFQTAALYASEGWLTPRFALQRLGTEWGRTCSPNTWTSYALRVCDQLQTGDYIYDARGGVRPLVGVGDLMHGKTDVIISDLRYKHEIEEVRAAGGKVVRIVRKERPATPAVNDTLKTVPGDLWELLENGEFWKTLNATTATHSSETEQKTLPDELFDHHIINGGNDLSLLEATVAGLAETLRST